MDENQKKLLNAAVGAVLRGERVKRGMSRQQFSDRSGIKFETVKSIETGRYKVSVLDMAAAADTLGIPTPKFVSMVMEFFEESGGMSAGSTTPSTDNNSDDPREMDAAQIDQLRRHNVALAAHPNDPESEQDEQYQ